jgi:general secretion pathway protein L
MRNKLLILNFVSVNFLAILNKLAQGIKDSNVTIEQFRFQNKTLIITVVCADFATLEKLEDRLKQLQLNVAQTQAANRDQQVVATLELK